MLKKQELGRLSEEVAAAYLVKRSYTVVDRNWRNRYSELDIVCVNEGNVLVVEVRSRMYRAQSGTNTLLGTAGETLTRKKLKHLYSGALAWCRMHGYEEEGITILLLVVTWYNARRFNVDVVSVW